MHICSANPTESHNGTPKKVVDMEGNWGLDGNTEVRPKCILFFFPFYTGESHKRLTEFPMGHARDQYRNNILLYLLSYFDKGRFF